MDKIDLSIFRAYDIRGVYPSQINAEIVRKISQAYVKLLSLPAGSSVALGRDMRLCGEEFAAAVSSGLTAAGINVIDLGLISTDQLYFAAATLPVAGGIQVTASHNPAEFGGLKLVKEGGRPISGENGIYEIRDMLAAGTWQVIGAAAGTISTADIMPSYFEHVLRSFEPKTIRPLKVVANANFGMAGPALEKLKSLLPVEFLEIIDGRPDGNFPKGPADPLLPGNRSEIMRSIKKLRPDLGVAWDGDADRCFFFDELGNFVAPAYSSALLARYYLQKHAGGKILHDTRVVRVIDKVVREAGGQAIATRAGHSYIKERMISENALFGCETSAHYYFKDNFYLDNGLMPFLAMLEILSAFEGTFSGLLRPLRENFAVSEEINFEFDNQDILADIKRRYGDAKIESIDGFDFNYPEWRFNVRFSNTQNLLRLNLEADSAALLQEKTAEVSAFIKAAASRKS